jgi:hypothetical protein
LVTEAEEDYPILAAAIALAAVAAAAEASYADFNGATWVTMAFCMYSEYQARHR